MNFTKKSSSNDDGNYAELLSIGVLPEKNGYGIGRDLLISFEKEIIKQGIKSITLTTDFNSNAGVLQFYNKLGYSTYYEFLAYPNRKMVRLIKKV